MTSLARTLLATFALAALLASCTQESVTQPPGTPPGKPRNVTAEQASANPFTIAVRWDAPLDSSGVDGYRVWWRDLPAGTLRWADLDGSTRRHELVLTAGQAYSLSVAAKRGTSYSETVSIAWP